MEVGNVLECDGKTCTIGRNNRRKRNETKRNGILKHQRNFEKVLNIYRPLGHRELEEAQVYKGESFDAFLSFWSGLAWPGLLWPGQADCKLHCRPI